MPATVLAGTHALVQAAALAAVRVPLQRKKTTAVQPIALVRVIALAAAVQPVPQEAARRALAQVVVTRKKTKSHRPIVLAAVRVPHQKKKTIVAQRIVLVV